MKQRRKDWDWNRPHSGGPDTTPRPIQPPTTSLTARVSAQLVDLMSALDELQGLYLTGAQRLRAAELLQESYLQLERLAASSRDSQLRRRLTHMLVVAGSLGVTPRNQGGEPLNESFIFLEALSRGSVSEWVDYFYLALHQSPGQTGRGRECYWSLNREVLEELRAAQQGLMHWIDLQV